MSKPQKPKASKAITKKLRCAPIQRSLQVDYWKLDRLVPFKRNARMHKEAQVGQIAESIATFGFTNPILPAMAATPPRVNWAWNRSRSSSYRVSPMRSAGN